MRREVETGHLVARSRERQQHAARPAAQLEKRAVAYGLGHALPEGDVAAVGVDGIVERGELVGSICAVVVQDTPQPVRHSENLQPNRITGRWRGRAPRLGAHRPA